MDTTAHAALVRAAKDQLKYCDGLLARIFATKLFLSVERTTLWDAFFIANFYSTSLETLLPLVTNTRLPWTSRLCSSVVDDAVPARGLLVQTLLLAIEAGLVADTSDAHLFRQDLFASINDPAPCLVAYIDYLGAGEHFEWRTFQTLWESMHANAVNAGLVGYCWRSSDSFYFAQSLKGLSQTDREASCLAFLSFLIRLQTNYCIGDESWMWMIGAALEKGTLVGDIFLPGNGGPAAASTMKTASDKIRGGGLIVIEKEFYAELPSAKRASFTRHGTAKTELYFYDRQNRDGKLA